MRKASKWSNSAFSAASSPAPQTPPRKLKTRPARSRKPFRPVTSRVNHRARKACITPWAGSSSSTFRYSSWSSASRRWMGSPPCHSASTLSVLMLWATE